MLVLGKDVSTSELVTIDSDARSRGIYLIGSTGTGKTTLLQSIAYQDMKAGHGVCVLDPHGDMIDWLLERIPEERVKDVILFDPGDLDYPIGINLLECNRDDPKQVRWVISNFVSALSRIFDYAWGPRLEHVLSHALWTAMKIEDSTILELLLLLINDKFKDKHTENLDEPLLKDFWDEFPKKNTNRRFDLVG
jgi:DNA helicase HerA-like ATPase